MPKITLSLGSNLGDKQASIAKAVSALCANGVSLVARSADYRTEPWGPVEQDWFVNACMLAETRLSPTDLLALCQKVERDLGRRREIKWGPRIIDIDILTYDDLALDLPGLILPHPYMLERAFVLVPLMEIASDIVVQGKPIAKALEDLGCPRPPRLDPDREKTIFDGHSE